MHMTNDIKSELLEKKTHNCEILPQVLSILRRLICKYMILLV